jgi:hypothetical protein
MRSIFFRLTFLLVAVLNIMQSYSQVKKVVVKKTVVTTKPKVAVKTNPALVAKSKLPVQAKTVAVKKVVQPAKAKAAFIVPSTVPNKPVNNSEITNVSLTNREQEMINEINNLRTNPAKYCTYVENYLQKNDVDDDVKTAAKN